VRADFDVALRQLLDDAVREEREAEKGETGPGTGGESETAPSVRHGIAT
jgi:hypothetical protein